MTRIDFLFIRRSPLPSEVFFARRSGFPISLVLIPIAVICIGWYVLSVVYSAASGDDVMAAPLSADERRQWSYFHDVVDAALKVQTLDDAFQAMSGIRYSVSNLPYRDVLHRLEANCCLDTAENHLTKCQMHGLIQPSYWRTEFTKALEDIPKYAGPLDWAVPPPDIEGE